MNFLQKLKNFSLAHLARNSEEAIVHATEELHDEIVAEVHLAISKAMDEFRSLRQSVESVLTPSPAPVDAPSSPPVATPAPVETAAATPVAQDPSALAPEAPRE